MVSRSFGAPPVGGVVAVTDSGLLVLVAESASLRNTVTYAIEQALEDADEADSTVPIHFVFPLPGKHSFGARASDIEAARSLLDRVESWAEADLDGDESVTVETALIGTKEYLSTPSDYAGVLVRYARAQDLHTAVFDPRYDPIGSTPLLPSLEAEVRRVGFEVQEAPQVSEQQSTPLVRRATLTQFLTLFGVSYLFYLLLAGSLAPFELATGAISAGIVAVSLWRVSLTSSVDATRTGARLGRLALYIPFLLWEIVKANFEIAYIVLHPDLPIDPKMVEFDAAVWSALPVTTLANSITLTPGTLTVDVNQQYFTVHSLTANARAGLFEGTLERAVRFLFYGRAAARLPSPLERQQEDEE